ncbi:hypothetical protein OHA25_17055 [Nonomuraea sp. NBC_00507]
MLQRPLPRRPLQRAAPAIARSTVIIQHVVKLLVFAATGADLGTIGEPVG